MHYATLPYAELQAISNFSFLEGASHPAELIAQAKALGLSAIGIADKNTLAGVVRAHRAAKDQGVRFLVGARLDLADGPSFLCYPKDRAAYGRLSSLLSMGQRRADKGNCRLYLADLFHHARGQVLVILPPEEGATPQFEHILMDLVARHGADAYLALSHRKRGGDARRIAMFAAMGRRHGIKLLVSNDVIMHIPARKPVQDVLRCIGAGVKIADAGYLLEANAERHIKSPRQMAALFHGVFEGWDAAVANTQEVVDKCRFSLDELRYNYPGEPVPEGETPQGWLEKISRNGLHQRFPDGAPEKITATLERELALVRQLNYAHYFLSVHDIVQFARGRGILCQGRGSAANSVICYALGITAVNPTEVDVLFERFISAERDEPPDIDVDFEHERREEVIQYIYARYGRHRAALAATVITYRARSAVRDVGKVMGLSEDVLSVMSRTIWGQWSKDFGSRNFAESGLDMADKRLRQVHWLAHQIMGFPRHLSQHVGGFVLTQTPLDRVVPIGNAAMDGRTVIEWDKDDLDALGILKIDVLALGMLSCIRKSFDLLRLHYGKDLSLARIPRDDGPTYDMLCRADSLGVFQVESRAQMNMLPRLRPRSFYDLVIQVAIVRPGPIQGDMVHPYLRRRNGEEEVYFPAPSPEFGPADELRDVLGKTLGVPLFQEQAMRVAIVAAGFTPAESDRLRRAMATFRHMGTINSFRDKLVGGMTARGYDEDFARRCFQQIEGFGEYGFPESHAASFAGLVYASSWLKCHYPAVFACGLLNSQPMGFYAPAQIIRNAREHGVETLDVDINHSEWDNILVPASRPEKAGTMALRLGFCNVDKLKKLDVAKLLGARTADNQMPFHTVEDLRARSRISLSALELLAAADCFRSIGLDRRRALWAVRALPDDVPLPLFMHAEADDIPPEEEADLPEMAESEQVMLDYQTLRYSLKAHPMSFLRAKLKAEGVLNALDILQQPEGARVRYAGIVLCRQRPGTAAGVVFMTLEDEFSIVNALAWKDVMARFRRAVMSSRLMLIDGVVQHGDGVTHLIADEITDMSALLFDLLDAGKTAKPMRHSHPRDVRLVPKSRDFH